MTGSEQTKRWLLICDKAMCSPDNRYSASELTQRLGRWAGGSPWTLEEIDTAREEYDEYCASLPSVTLKFD